MIWEPYLKKKKRSWTFIMILEPYLKIKMKVGYVQREMEGLGKDAFYRRHVAAHGWQGKWMRKSQGLQTL